MDFGLVELDPQVRRFRDEVRSFCTTHVTQSVLDEEMRYGAGFNLALHRALGERGWILPRLPLEIGGAALSALEAGVLHRELRLANAPLITMGTTTLVVPAIRTWGAEELQADLIPGIAKGDVRICLGYTEPGSGSDVASARARAVKDGDSWLIRGQKIFTTGAQNCQYSFVLARTDPSEPKHGGLTMFLVPLDSAEIRPIRTLGGERTNAVFYDDVRVPDVLRLGPVNQGWSVLLGPLNAEHAMSEDEAPPLDLPGGQYGYSGLVALDEAVTWARTPADRGKRPIDDPIVRQRLARHALDAELATTSTGPAGRVISSEASIRIATDLINLVGPRGVLPRGTEGCIGEGWIEHGHRFAQGTAIYGGTTDIFRNIIAERVLGLPRSGLPARPRLDEARSRTE